VREKELFGRIVQMKNNQMLKERKRIRELELANMIISAYLVILLKKSGCVRIPKSLISKNLQRYRVTLDITDNDYIIDLVSINENADTDG